MKKTEFEKGFLAALAAFGAWGLLPAYWKQLDNLQPLQILCHRIVWSLLFVAIVLTVQHRWGSVVKAIKTRKTLGLLLLSGLAIGVNWFVYIWAVNSGKVIETSLGYFINPLVSVLFAVLFLREKLSTLQWSAIVLAGLAILYQVILVGRVPFAALSIAVSFALYALIRKVAEVESFPGLFIETLLLVFPALFYLFVGLPEEPFLAGETAQQKIWLLSSGIVTSLPLICFAYGARRLPLSMLGIMEYLAPTLSFLLGFFVYKEPFDRVQLLTFVCVWVALALFTGEKLLRWRRMQHPDKDLV